MGRNWDLQSDRDFRFGLMLIETTPNPGAKHIIDLFRA